MLGSVMKLGHFILKTIILPTGKLLFRGLKKQCRVLGHLVDCNSDLEDILEVKKMLKFEI